MVIVYSAKGTISRPSYYKLHLSILWSIREKSMGANFCSTFISGISLFLYKAGSNLVQTLSILTSHVPHSYFREVCVQEPKRAVSLNKVVSI